MSSTKRPTLAADSIRTALVSLATLPDSDDVAALRRECLAVLDRVHAWSARPPSADERERTMKEILALHVAVAKLTISLRQRC